MQLTYPSLFRRARYANFRRGGVCFALFLIFLVVNLFCASIIFAQQPNLSKAVVLNTKPSLSGKNERALIISRKDAETLLVSELKKANNADLRKIKQYLLFGANVRSAGPDGWSVLHTAAMYGDLELAEVCLAKGVPVNGLWHNSLKKLTPLCLAVKNNRTDAAKLLREKKGTYGVADGVSITQVYDSGNVYGGGMLNGERSGEGTLTFADGEKYVGNWLADEMSGFGVFCYVEGSKYMGNWQHDKMNGSGIFFMSNGDSYEGNWVNGVLEGEGKFGWRNGNRLS